MQTIKITASISPEWQRANAKAAAQYRAGVRGECLDDRHYRIPSATEPRAYVVRVDSVSRLEAHCECVAGQHGKVCHHASMALSLAAERIRQYARPASEQPALARVSPEAFAARFAA